MHNAQNLEKVIHTLAQFNVSPDRVEWLASYILNDVCCGDVQLAIIHAGQPAKSNDGKLCW